MAADRPRQSDLCLIFTETARDDVFTALAQGRVVPDGWEIQRVPGDAAALWAVGGGEAAPVLLVAGRQIVTEEGVEVLALATAAGFADGRAVRDVLRELRSVGIPAVLPWGLGKWMGARGATVAALVAEFGAGGLMLGDNAGRPMGWATPPLFRQAVAMGMPVLPGSDPLPLAGAEAGIGRFGCLIEGRLDPVRPAEDLRARLFNLRGQPAVIGRRKGVGAVVVDQIALRWSRIAGSSARGPGFS